MFDKAILHIGSTKTGSSAIQSGLVRHRDQLRKRGYCYVSSKADEKAEKGFVTAGNSRKLLNVARAGSDAKYERKRQKFLDDIESAADAGSIIFSGEALVALHGDYDSLIRGLFSD